MKTVAIVSNTSWYIYNFRKGLIDHLLAKGYKVYAISGKDKFIDEIKACGCEYIELKYLKSKGKNPFKDVMLTWELRSLFKKLKIDYCLFYTPKINIYGSIAIKKTPTTGLATINGLGFVFNDNQHPFLKKIVLALYRFAFKNVYSIFFQNTEDREFFLGKRIITKNNNTQIINGSGVNLDIFSFKNSFNSSDKLIFLMSARLLAEKGVFEYLTAAEKIKEKFPSITFMLVGLTADNPSAVSQNVLTDYHKRGIINYIGETDNMNSVLNKVDVLVLPSYYREGIPRVLLEGLSKGLPIITTDNVGCRETVEDNKNGFLIPVKDAVALQFAMEKLINLPVQERQEMGLYSRQIAINKFNEVDNHQAYMDIIEKTN